MTVVGEDGALEIETGYLIWFELRRVHHLLSGLVHCNPLFAQVATNLLNWDQEVLFPYPQEASGAHYQKARKARISIDTEVLYTPYLLTANIVDFEPADILPGLFEAEVRIAHLDEAGLLLCVFHSCLLSQGGVSALCSYSVDSSFCALASSFTSSVALPRPLDLRHRSSKSEIAATRAR